MMNVIGTKLIEITVVVSMGQIVVTDPAIRFVSLSLKPLNEAMSNNDCKG